MVTAMKTDEIDLKHLIKLIIYLYNCIEFTIRQRLVCGRDLRKSNGRKASGKRSRKDTKRQNKELEQMSM